MLKHLKPFSNSSFRVIKFRVLNGKIIILPSHDYRNALKFLSLSRYFYRISKGAHLLSLLFGFSNRKCEYFEAKKKKKKKKLEKNRVCFQMNFLAILIATCYMIMVSVSCSVYSLKHPLEHQIVLPMIQLKVDLLRLNAEKLFRVSFVEQFS